jgi:excisionase family DNA binding protein
MQAAEEVAWPDWVNVEGFAQMLPGTSKRTVYAWIASGEAPQSFRVGKRLYFKRSDCLAWIERHRVTK